MFVVVVWFHCSQVSFLFAYFISVFDAAVFLVASVSTAILAGLAGISHVDQELLRSPSRREIISGSVILKPAIRRFFFFREKEKSQGRLEPPDGRLHERPRREGRSRARESERCKSPLTT